MNDSTFRVTEKARRPASTANKCFYCAVEVGGYHKLDCVLIQKSVKVRMIVEYDIHVPSSWDADDVAFHRNEGSWCANNAITELQTLKKSGCLCAITRFEVVDINSTSFANEEEE